MNKRLLVVVAHPDDESLGCGASIAKYAQAGWQIAVLALADGETARPGAGQAEIEVRQGQFTRACKLLGTAHCRAHSLPDNRLDSLPLLDIIQLIEAEIAYWQPVQIWTHWSDDLNIDHRCVSEAVSVAARPSSAIEEIRMFEVPSSSDWQFSTAPFKANLFESFDKTCLEKKLQACKLYRGEFVDSSAHPQECSQAHPPQVQPSPHPRSEISLRSLATQRGIQSGCQMAEAFSLLRARR